MSNGGTFVEVAQALLSPVVATNAIITSGASLVVRYRAFNVHGWSLYSDTATILAATVPSPPLQLVSTIVQLNNYVTLSWSLPANPGG